MNRSKNNLENKIILYTSAIISFVVIILSIIYLDELKLIYSNPETVRQFILGFGIFAPIVFIIFQILQVVIFFIPSSLFTISGGYAFGPIFGTLYSLIGIMIGSIIVFYVTRKLGRPFVRRIINNKELDHFDVFFKKRGNIALFITRAIPMLFPTDVVSFAAGLTSMKLRNYILYSFLGFIPNLFILTLFGDQLTKGVNLITIALLTILGFAILGYILRHELKVIFIKEIREYEKKLELLKKKSSKEIKIVEKEIEFKFHKWKKQLLVADKILSVVIILLLGVFKPDYVVIAAYLLIIPYLFLTQRKILFKHLFISSVVALIWMLIAKNQYGYNQDFIAIFGINLFPLFAWAIGLFIVYIIYSHYEHILKECGFVKKLILFVIIYVPLLIAVETIAYHLFNIKNLAAAAYPGLPICDCIHAPLWMQASYIALGPIFFSLCYMLKLENPHFKIKKKVLKR